MTRRIYCSYFDHRYLPRGLLLMESIWQYNPDSHFYVLCLNDECKTLLDRIADPRITAIPLQTLEAFDPELAAVKSTRSTVEYYFTCTPCLPNYLFRIMPELESVTYLDADLWFFADPELIYDEIGDASIAITPHRFSPERLHLARFGRYNVGWITWRNDAAGRSCVEDYRRECIEWCYDRLEESRFADQKYLDRWPSAYPSVCEISHIGVNVAGWNINGYTLSLMDDMLLVNDKRVVFYHYHALRQTPEGRWITSIDRPTSSRHPLLIDRIYRPYVERLKQKTADLESRFGSLGEYSDIRYQPQHQTAQALKAKQAAKAAPRPPEGGWAYVGPSWPDDGQLRNGGWTGDSIVQVRARQLDEFRQRPPALLAGNGPIEQTNALLCAAAINRLCPDVPSVSLLDWGGAVGATGLATRPLLHPRDIEYTVTEVPDVCEAFGGKIPGVRFLHDEDAALSETYDVILASASLHYRNDWRSLLARLAKSARRGLLLNRQPVISKAPSYVAQQTAYGTTFTCWILNEQELITEAQRNGLQVMLRVLSHDHAQIAGAPAQPVFQSYILARQAPGAGK